MAHTFHWTLSDIYKVRISEMNKLILEHNDFVDKQNKEMQKASKGKSGKTQIASLGQMHNLPGVKKVKKSR